MVLTGMTGWYVYYKCAECGNEEKVCIDPNNMRYSVWLDCDSCGHKEMKDGSLKVTLRYRPGSVSMFVWD